MTQNVRDLIAEAKWIFKMQHGLLTPHMRETFGPLVDALEASLGERDAAVAAVERVRDILNRDDFGDDWEHDEWVYRQAAERKLADIEEALGSVMLAVPDAIARVRELHRESEAYRETCVECSVGENLIDWPCRTFQALDGAPEPEWEYGTSIPESLQDDGEWEPSREMAIAHVESCDAGCVLVRRRRAGEWEEIPNE